MHINQKLQDEWWKLEREIKSFQYVKKNIIGKSLTLEEAHKRLNGIISQKIEEEKNIESRLEEIEMED